MVCMVVESVAAVVAGRVWGARAGVGVGWGNAHACQLLAGWVAAGAKGRQVVKGPHTVSHTVKRGKIKGHKWRAKGNEGE